MWGSIIITILVSQLMRLCLPWLLLLTHAAVLGVRPCDDQRRDATQASLGDHKASTKCPDANWKTEFYKSATMQNLQRPVVVFDIGCNKGYPSCHCYP